jgi:hypothetical protein
MRSGDTDYFEVGRVQALRLYEKYKQLVAAGEFHDKLLEIYRYGRRHGWEISNDMTMVTAQCN